MNISMKAMNAYKYEKPWMNISMKARNEYKYKNHEWIDVWKPWMNISMKSQEWI